MTNKNRWMRLAGIVPKKDTTPKTKQNLSEGFTNLGMASPGIMGNPFDRRKITSPTTRRVTTTDIFREWQEVFEAVGINEASFENVDNPSLIKQLGEAAENWIKTREYGDDNNKQDEDQIKTRKYGEDDEQEEEINEAQLAVDPFEGHSERDYNGPGYDIEQNPEIQTLPRQLGSVADDEFTLDDFNPEDEDLSIRSLEDYENSDDEGMRNFDYPSDHGDDDWQGLRGMPPEDYEEYSQKIVDDSNSSGRRRRQNESRSQKNGKRSLKERVESADELQQELKRLIIEADDIFDLLLAGKTKFNRKLLKEGRSLLRKCHRAVSDATSPSLGDGSNMWWRKE